MIHHEKIRVSFNEVDSMEVVWHGHTVRYFEVARCALLDKIDYNYLQMRESGYAWPVIDLQIRYYQPAFFNQEILVAVTLKEWENRLVFEYLISDASSGEKLTKGKTTQVAVDIKTKELCFMSPAILFEKLKKEKP